MPIEKHCVARGCSGLALYGFGSALNGSIRWACRQHRGLIWIDDAAAAPPAQRTEGRAAAVAGSPARPSPSPPPKQGRLFG